MYAQSSLLKAVSGKKTQHGGNIPAFTGEKMLFLAMVFSTLTIQLSVSYATIKYLETNVILRDKLFRYIILFHILQFGIIIVLSFVPMHPAIKFALFTIFSVISGITLSKVAMRVSPDLFKGVLISTLCIFVVLVVVGLIISATGINISWLGWILMFILLCVIVIYVAMLLMKTSKRSHKIMATVSLLLFALFIIYDTNHILQRDYNGDFVTAAIDYYLDIINMLLSLLNMKME